MAVTAEKRRQIIEDVHETWNELIEVLQSFDSEELEQPDVIGIWSLKDLVGHLETWDRIAIKKIGYAEEGRTESWWKIEEIPFKSIDEFNEADADANRHLRDERGIRFVLAALTRITRIWPRVEPRR
jgi:uncharacterized damage-inducible protein DinB